MKNREYHFNFGGAESRVFFQQDIPVLDAIRNTVAAEKTTLKTLLVCDTHTEYIARVIASGNDIPIHVLSPGEDAKNWPSVEGILRSACNGGLGRDSLFIGAGGGVVGDLTAFAASIYMRGAKLCIVSTTLLGMVDAALGGKTGFDLFGIKNMAGTFYPAHLVYMPLKSLSTLPQPEWKSGMAELIKTAILDEDNRMFTQVRTFLNSFTPPLDASGEALASLIGRSMEIKGRIVESDPKETGKRRALLNLGHSFGHALETAAGLGKLSHGEAVAWGMAQAAEFGRRRGITPPSRAKEIRDCLEAYGYEVKAPHPLVQDGEALIKAMTKDKKNKNGKLTLVVPGEKSACLETAEAGDPLLKKVINGAL